MGCSTVKIVLRKDKINRNLECPIHIRIIKQRKTSYVATGIMLKASYWNFEASNVKRNHPNSVRLNLHLQKLCINYTDEVLKTETANQPINGKTIKKMIEGDTKTSFFEIAKDLAKKYLERKSVGSYRKAMSIINKLELYTGEKDILLEDFDVKFLLKYESYLAKELNNSVNTIGKNFKYIRTVFKYAIRQDLVNDKANPFNNYQIKSEQTNRVFLTLDEIEAFRKVEGSELMNRCRDIALFQYYSGGLRISDVLLLKVKETQNDKLNFTIHKTGTQISHILNERALEIINKYRLAKKGNTFVFDFLPANLDEQAIFEVDKYISRSTCLINKYLKLIAQTLEIPKLISTHSFRHSFAINALQKGIRIEAIQKILKHSNMRETQIYARLQDQQINEALEIFGK